MPDPTTLNLENRELQVRFNVKAAVFDVSQKRSGTRWKMDRADRRDLVIRLRGGEERVLALSEAREIRSSRNQDGSIRVRYGRFRGIESSLAVSIVLEIRKGDLAVELDVEDADPGIEFDSLYYPRGFDLPNRKDAYWIFPEKGGKLVPATFRRDIDARLGWKPKLKCHGAVQGRSGFLCLWNTPFDVLLADVNTRRGGPKFFPRNLECLGRFRYKRRFTFAFREKTDYAALILDVFRPHAQRQGYLLPLKDRAKAKPRINALPGTAMLHQMIASIDTFRLEKKVVTFEHAKKVFKEVVKRTGLKRGLYHLDGWCRRGYDALHPDILPPLDEAGGEAGLAALSKTVSGAGFQFGLHDNYLLYYLDAEQCTADDAVWDHRLRPFRNRSSTEGMANYVQSPSAAKRFVTKNYLTGQNEYRRRWRPLSAYCKLGFGYFDQFLHSGGGYDQDFNPSHLLTRRDFINGMLDIIDMVSEKLGIIISSEHMYDFAMPHYDVNGNGGGVSLKDPAEGVVPVPLWNLAFHECMVTNDSDGNPLAFVKAGLLGGIVHHSSSLMEGHYWDDPESLEMLIGSIKSAAPLRRLHREVCFRRCTGSRLLKQDGSVQEADYEGLSVRADFGNRTIEVDGSRRADGLFRFDGKPESGG